MEDLVMVNKSFWRNKRVLVTGHSGFKGCWLSIWLKTMGADVWGYALNNDIDKSIIKLDYSINDNDQRYTRTIRNEFADIRDYAKLSEFVSIARPEVVFHLAAQPLVLEGYRDPIKTWETNVLGTINLLEALKELKNSCSAVIITTDKVYANKEWEYGYREVDQLGGHDPYSASKAAAEIAVDSWRSSFCGNYCYQTPHLSIATARAGNVVGGGDWSVNRLVPDAMRALEKGETIKVRNPKARRPWQHVLEPLSGYLMLAERLSTRLSEYRTAFNFGPTAESNRSVEDMIEAITHYWPTGVWEVCTSDDGRHEAEKLHLQIDKAFNLLGWSPKWEFDTTVKRTVEWYRDVSNGADAEECCLRDIAAYTSTMRSE